MFLLIILITTLTNILVLAQKCDPIDFGKGSIVCQCNSTYCDYHPDPPAPNRGEFILYSSSKGGKRLERYDGKISKEQRNGNKVIINAKKQYQKIEGFGGAFTDAALLNIKSLSSNAQEHLMRSYFSSNGSKYNLVRVTISGSDYSTRGYTYDDVEGDTTLTNFSLTKEDTEWKIPLMKEALKLNPELRFLAASWTAPPWMKNRHSYNGFTYLQKKYYQVYAEYTVKFLEEYKNNGLDIWAVSTGNEPFLVYTHRSNMNTMYWSSSAMSQWVINNLGPTLKKSSSNATAILILDDQRITLPWFMIYIKMRYNEALKYIKGIALHWYLDDLVSAEVLSLTHDKFPDKFILMTEACVEPPVEVVEAVGPCIVKKDFIGRSNYKLRRALFYFLRARALRCMMSDIIKSCNIVSGERVWEKPDVILGSWSRAERLITKLFENLNHWIVGWVDWNLALDNKGGPNWVHNYVDAPIIVDAVKDVFYKQPLYYAMIHFSKFIPRNAIKIQAESNNGNILSTAFKTSDNQKIVLLYNQSNKKRNVSVFDEEIGNINIELAEDSLHTILYKM